MVDKGTARHIFTEGLIVPVATVSGLSRRQAKRAINATVQALGDALADGNDITIQGLGRFRIGTVKSHWRTDLAGKRIAQKMFHRIYFSPSPSIQNRLNRHLHEGGRKNAKGKAHPERK